MAAEQPATCLLCAGEVSDPADIAPRKAWWPLMVTCTNEDCIAFGVHVAADPDEMERSAYANPDATEPKFAHSGDECWFVSTIYRRSSATDGGWYYETHGYLLTGDGSRRWLYEASAGYPRWALRVHAILSKRASRLYGSPVPA